LKEIYGICRIVYCRGGVMEVKNKLKEIRMREYMMDSGEFAKFLGVPRSTYSQWETGNNNPTLNKAFEIAEKLERKLVDIWYSE